MEKIQVFRTSREKEIGGEFGMTIQKLYDTIKNKEYVDGCKLVHENLIKSIIKKPVKTYKELRENSKNSQLHLEAIILILLEKIFDIDVNEKEIFRKRIEDEEKRDTEKKDLEKDMNQYDAMFELIIIKVSHVLFKSRFYLTYRPSVEVIVDMLSFIDIMCRTNKEKCRGASNPYFHTRRYLYYLKFMLDQYDKGHIVMPTYLSIGATDFIKIRCIPIYLLGCHPESEFADEYYNTPLDFFSHDVQHARRQLYYTEEQLYKLNDKYERFKNYEKSRSPFDVDNSIVLEEGEKKFDEFINSMSLFTKNVLLPLLLVPKDNKHKAPLNDFVTVYNESLAKGLRSMRKMIIFELLHEAALVTLPDVMIKGIIINTHTTPIERISDTHDNYADVENIIYQDPSTLSNVLYKIQGTFFDTLEERFETIVPVFYRNAVIVTLAALQVLTELAKVVTPEKLLAIDPDLKNIGNPDIIFNKLLHLTLNKKNRLQSTTGVAIEGSVDPHRVFTIREVIDESGNLLPVAFDKVHTTRTTIYEDTVLLKNNVTFYGPVLGDQSGKVCVYGGSFDPPHNCHKLRIQQLYDALSLNKVVIAIVGNNPRKPNLLPQEDRYKWTLMMVEEILNENNDPSVTDFKSNPAKNKSKIDVTMAEPSVGDTIIRFREEYSGNDIIFVYGSDYALKSGKKTPLDDFDKPPTHTEETNFYHDVTQIQFLRSEHMCNTSSSDIRTEIDKFMAECDLSSINPLADEDITIDPLCSELVKLSVQLNMSKKVLLSYIRFIMKSKKKGGFNKDIYFKKYLKYKTKYLELRKLL